MTLLGTLDGAYAIRCADLLSIQNETGTYHHLSSRILKYLGQWNQLVNHDRQSLHAIYGGIGPDLSTPLLSTGATEITGIDRYSYNTALLKSYLAAWETIDQADPKLKPTFFRRAWSDLSDGQELVREWEIATQLRKIRGYYDYSAIENWSYERFLIYELKMLGVPQESISISELPRQNAIRIQFLWGANGESPKLRSLTIYQGDIFDFFHKSENYSKIKRADVFIIKSVPRIENFDQFLGEVISHFLNQKATIFAGASFYHQSREERRTGSMLQTLSSYGFARDQRLSAQEEALRDHVLESNNAFILNEGIDSDLNDDWSYGWLLYRYFRTK